MDVAVKTRQWVLELPYTKPPLSLNDRMHWARKAKLARELRRWTRVLADAHNIPRLTHARVELHYHPRDRRRRDADNLYATVKPCVDGLRDAGVIDDDDMAHVTHLQPVIEPATGGAGRLELHIYEGA
jgi:crossover junction endodeoxyribonuclease RusA